MSRRVALVLLLVASLALPVVAPAGAQDAPGNETATPSPTPTATPAPNGTASPNATENATPTPTATPVGGPDVGVRSADLAIAQPHYVDADVSERSVEGRPLYVAEGAAIRIRPRNFAPANVVDFGVIAGEGTLSYDPTMQQYVFEAGATGTHRLYWIVEREQTAPNGTERVTTRYSARLRVTGGLDLVHEPAGNLEAIRQQADNWEEFNATLLSETYAGPDADPEQAIQEMLDWYRLRTDPLAALTGNFTSIIILLFTSPGGILVLLFLLGPTLWLIYQLSKRLRRHEVIESEEGEVKSAIDDLDRRERIRTLQNMDPFDIFEDDHVAGAWRDQHGETAYEAAVDYLNKHEPRRLLADRLRAMGQSGYVAVERDDLATDGGQPEAAYRLQQREEAPDDATVHELTDVAPDDKLLDGLDWEAPELVGFDLPAAEYDPREIDVDYESHDLDALIDRYGADMRHFSDPATYGRYLMDFVATVRDGPLTDDEGRVDGVRYVMNAVLMHAQKLDDRFDFPVMHYHAEAVERALIDYDPKETADRMVQDVQNRAVGEDE